MNITSLKRPYTTTSLLILLNTVSLGSYYAHGKEALTQDIDSDRAAKKGYREIGRMNLQLSPIKGHSTGEGIAAARSEVKLAPPAKLWDGHWDAGQFRLPTSGRVVLRAEVKGGSPYFRLQAYGGSVLPEPDAVKFENNLYEAVWLRKTSEPQTLSALWLTLTAKGDAEASAKILELSVWQPQVENKLDADKILETPPFHLAELKLHNGAMTLFLDGKPISGQMWSSICNHFVSHPYLTKVLNGLEYPIAAIPFAVGEHSLHNPPLYPSSWLGPDEYDWSYIDTEARRVLAARPGMKLVLMLALDGAVWWDDAHPEAANVEMDVLYAKWDKNAPGVPDYLSPLWRRHMRELLRQLVAHVQTADWGESVIGYELFNGGTMDCNFKVPHSNPRAMADFRRMLTKKYASTAALQNAWNNPEVTLDSALLWTESFPPGLILEPANNQWFIDSKEWIANQFRMVFSDVAAILKEATHHRALVGARTGDFFGNYGWDAGTYAMEDSGWLPPLLADPNFDFFDVQEPYPGRQLGGGAGVPVLPPHALQQYGKTVFIQNDVRTHLSEPNVGYGRTPDLESTIQLQRRVFANALTYNMNPYLFQMEFGYNQPELLAEYRKQELILRAAATRDRSSVAETAIVLDPEMRLYLGADTKYSAPTRYFALFDFTKHAWQRAGASFDMIFLDQIESLPPYRVYVFYHTWRYTPKQLRTIRQKVLTNGQCAVFLWADGVISDEGTFSAKIVSELTGMKLQMSPEPSSWHMIAAKGVSGIAAGTEAGTLSKGNYDVTAAPDAADWEYEPSFRIEAGETTVPLAHRADGSLSAAMRREADYTVIYSASGNLTPPIFRLALERAGAFRYTDSSALLMMNRSYLAFHTDKDETIKLKIPTAQRLVNLFSGEEFTTSTVFEIPVRRNHTYVFERH
jgi:hypothetical protein